MVVVVVMEAMVTVEVMVMVTAVMVEVMVVGALSSVILHVYVKINKNIYYWVLHKIKHTYICENFHSDKWLASAVGLLYKF